MISRWNEFGWTLPQRNEPQCAFPFGAQKAIEQRPRDLRFENWYEISGLGAGVRVEVAAREFKTTRPLSSAELVVWIRHADHDARMGVSAECASSSFALAFGETLATRGCSREDYYAAWHFRDGGVDRGARHRGPPRFPRSETATR